MKAWVIKKIAGPLGFVVRPILAAIVGTLVALAYEQAALALEKVAWLQFFIGRVTESLPADVALSLSPGAIGAASALAIWAFASDWIISKLKAGNRQIQNTVNASSAPVSVGVDGIIIKDGETSKAVSRLAYEAMYPDDAANRGGDGMPETRRPLP